MAFIELTNLTKTFGKISALDDVNLQIEGGEIFGFLGPNGAGKSTAIRCMMGFLYPDRGSIEIDGSKVERSTTKYLEKVGYVSSDLELNEKWTGNEHINFLMKARNLQNYPSDLIDRLGLKVDENTKNLSSGNKQKLAFILALMHKPSLLLLDEPTKGLDPLLQEEIYKILIEFKNSGGCVFFSSHNLAEVERVCDRVGIIRKGKIVANETMDTLQHKHIHIINVVFVEGIEIPNLSSFGIIDQKSSTEVAVRVEGDINPILKILSQYKLSDIKIDHASLEDTFLHFYEEN